jgi:tripartite-type tricarboxylate transporter receptor subunit TctC
MVEAGIPQFDVDMWVGMFARSDTPRDIVDKLYQETQKAIQKSRSFRKAHDSRWPTDAEDVAG